MQKPHWGTPWRTNASCSGCRVPSAVPGPRWCGPSGRGPACASIRQLATSLPSTWTVQAPQSPVPQPSLGPVSPRSSRSASSSVDVRLDEHLDGLAVDGAAAGAVWPRGSASGSGARALERGGERATGEDADQVTAELDGAALIVDGPGRLDRQRGRALDAPRASPPGPRAPARPRWRGPASGATDGERDARLGAAPVRRA